MIARVVWLLGLTAGWTVAADAQDLTARINAVDNGTVRVAFPTREGMCGSGQNVRFSTGMEENADWESECEPGPARVVIGRRAGRTVSIDTYLGGRWRVRPGVTDLGTVTGAAAADAFLSMAEQLGEAVAEDAIFPAAVAEASVWPRLVRLAANRERPSDVREQAVFWVGQTGGDDAVDPLVGLLADPNADFRDKVVFALSQTRSERGNAALRDIVRDPSKDSGIREKAIFWLGQSRVDENTGFLKEAFRTLRDENLQEKIIFAMSQRRTEENADWLIDEVVLAGNTSDGLREKAVFWLGQMREQGQRLIGLYDRVSTDELREKLIFAYSQRRDEAMVEKLVDIARNDARPELRRKAIFWLGQSRHPKAIEFLAELIGS